MWAQIELVARQCAEVQHHVDRAGELSKTADSLGAGMRASASQLTGVRNAVADRCDA